MIINGFRGKLRQAGFYFPFTLYFVFFVVAAFAAWKMLHQKPYDPYSSFNDIFTTLLKVAAVFGLLLLGLALLSVGISAIYFFLQRKKNRVDFRIATEYKISGINQKQKVSLSIKPILKPLFGFIKIRLQYDQTHYSDKFSLLEAKKQTLISNAIEGIYHWPLPEIKEYHVAKAIIYFEDYFQFFSIAADLPANDHFYTQPSENGKQNLNIKPRKTEETNTRIDEMRKVEGEYLNYKNFENNDDVRRIVWKIYAKNKELVVRMPETMDPYASHVDLYASFFTNLDIEGNEVANIPFLNHYKTFVWSTYRSLVSKGLEVRYVADQDIAKAGSKDEQQAVKYSISTSKWQTGKDLRTFTKTRDASIIILSSLSDPQQVHELVERHGNEITFIFVKLSDSLRTQNMADWVQWLFVQNEKSDNERYKTSWATSFTLRPRIVENEKALANILAKYQLQPV